MYLFERILERLAKSPYSKNFILKVGLLISSMMGISERTTMDMDTTVRGITMEEDEIVEVIKSILLVLWNWQNIRPEIDDPMNYRFIIRFFNAEQKKLDVYVENYF